MKRKYRIRPEVLGWTRRVLHLLGVLLGTWLILGILWVGFLLYESAALTRIEAANVNARNVMEAFAWAAEDLKKDGTRPAHSEMVYTGRLDAPDAGDALQCRMAAYSHADGYYAVVTDQDWHAFYVLWSRSEITQNRIRPYTVSDQRSFMFSPFEKHGELIGCYEAEEAE